MVFFLWCVCVCVCALLFLVALCACCLVLKRKIQGRPFRAAAHTPPACTCLRWVVGGAGATAEDAGGSGAGCD